MLISLNFVHILMKRKIVYRFEAVPTVVSQPVIKQHKPQENSYTSHEENLEELKGLFESIDASDLIQNLMEDKELRKVYRSLTDDD